MAKYRLVRSIAVAGVAGALSVAACQSVSGLGDLQFDKSDTPPCEDDVDCDQGNRCTTGTCDPSGTCLYVAEDDGPLAEQIDGDCRRVDCHSGQEVEVIDATDDDDGNDCTQDACEGEDASPSHTSVPDATMCVLQDGTAGYCKGGTCGSDCTEATAYLCDDANDCTIDSCDTTIGKCAHQPLTGISPPNDPGFTGDCKKYECQAGALVEVADTTDVPYDDGNDCTTEECNGELPLHLPKTAGTSCSFGVCNASGQCVECTTNLQCTPPDTCGGGGFQYQCGCTPKSCSTLGKFCGTVDNGCGQLVSCNDFIQDNGETDIDCGGTSCSQKCSLGQKCSLANDCASGFCADGVCCGSACTATCQACSNIKTGFPDGTCAPVLNGQTDTNCLSPMACDGTGLCK